MKLESVRIENYRAIERLRLRFDPQLTVLHGDNAHGKTSVLSAIAVGLGAIPTLLPGVSGIGFLKGDRREGRGARISLTTTDGVGWERTSGLDRLRKEASEERDGEGRPRPRLTELKKWLERTDPRASGNPVDLPILAFYDTGRTVPGFEKRRDPSKGTPSRYSALAGALSAKTSFRELFEWFYSKENEELREQRERRDHDYRSRELSAVRTAISSMIEGVTGLRVELRPLRFVVSERVNGKTAVRTLDQLSGGYQAVLALAADLAWRMAQGNPHRSNPLESEAIGLIDEIELHLHPSWQQRILGDLTRTFPNAQFIVTTHSPQVLTTVQPDRIVELVREGDRICARQAADATFGAKAGDVLSTVMGVDERPAGNRFVKTLSEYTSLVSAGQGESAEARSLRWRLEKLSPREPALDRADIEIRRRRVMREVGKSG